MPQDPGIGKPLLFPEPLSDPGTQIFEYFHRTLGSPKGFELDFYGFTDVDLVINQKLGEGGEVVFIQNHKKKSNEANTGKVKSRAGD
jgi:hypothetical protein